MKPPIFSILTFISCMSVISGCSVKEERDGCPCRLFLDLTSIDILDQAPVTLNVLSGDEVEYTAVFSYDNYIDTCVVEVPRRDYVIVGWSNTEGYMDEDGLTIPLGHDSPPVYIYTECLTARDEAVYGTVCLKKNYCVLNVAFVEPADVTGLVVRGEIAGFDMSGNPRMGEFRVSTPVGAMPGESSCFHIPRQNGNALYLDVTEQDGVVKSFSLHDYISEFGYDWTDPDLDDLNILLEYTPVGVSVTIQGWEREIVINVVI